MKLESLMPLALSLAVISSACGSGEMSLTEYVDHINAAAEAAGQKADALTAADDQYADVTPQMVQTGLERGLREIRIPLQETVDDIEPPASVAALHHLLWDWHARFIDIEQMLAERFGTAQDTEADWIALSDSAEMAAYRASIAEGKQVCIDFQAELDSTAERGVFEDNPWLPGEMKEVVYAALGCQWFPDNPEDVYRYPPVEVTFGS